VLLVCVGYTLFLVYAVRPVFIRVLRRSRALQDGPSQGIIALTLLLALGSAFFTGIIGVHAIFGAFLAGMICPHEGGFNIKVAEKIEDLISALFLPLYFTLSGLNTNVGLLDSGIVWAYVVGVCAVAFFGKFFAATAAARLSGMLWRECLAIGSLMSCKGLVELIVLVSCLIAMLVRFTTNPSQNIGLQAKILSTRTFTIFVVMALVTTFVTSPLTIQFYPEWYQKKVEAFRRGEIDWDGKPLDSSDSVIDAAHYEKLETNKIRRFTVYLRLDSMPNLLAFASLFGAESKNEVKKLHPSLQRQNSTQDVGNSTDIPERPVQAHGLRLLNLTDRGSSVMQVYESESYTTHDPVVNIFRTFGRLHNLAISGETLVVPEDSFPDTLSSRAADSDFLLLPWSETGGMSEQAIIEDKGTKNKLAAPSYMSFVHEILNRSTITTAVLVNKNFGGPKNKPNTDRSRLLRRYSSVSLTSHRDAPVTAPLADKSHHIFFPFFGGSDDRSALRLVLQLAENPKVTATLVHFEVPESMLARPSSSSESAVPVKGAEGTVITTTTHDSDATFFASLRASLPAELASRVIFETVPSTSPFSDVIARAGIEVGQAPKNAGDLVVLGRNLTLTGLATEDAADEIKSSHSSAATLGVLAERVWEAKLGASILVVKAGQSVHKE
jgi:hypothetical protein